MGFFKTVERLPVVADINYASILDNEEMNELASPLPPRESSPSLLNEESSDY